MTMLGMTREAKVNHGGLIRRMRGVIGHDGDVRPVWLGGGFATTDIAKQKAYAHWANIHWGIYYTFMNEVDSLENKKILDLGCGAGNCTANLAVYFKDADITAYDIDPVCIAFCKDVNQQPGVNYEVQDLRTCELPQQMDYIFFIEILEHVRHEHHYPIVDKVLEALKPGGKLFLSTPNEEVSLDKKRGHIGILSSKHYKKFVERYSEYITESNFVDNTKLAITEDCVSDDDTLSHYRIVLQKPMKE